MSLLPSVNNGSTLGPLFIPIDGAVNPFPIPGPPGAQGAVGPAGPQGLQGVNAYGSWYYATGSLPPAPQSLLFDSAAIYFSLVSIPPGGDAYLRALETQFNSTGAMTLYINSTDVGGAAIGFTAAISAVNFFDGLGYAVFSYVLVGPAPTGFVNGNEVSVFDGGGTVGPIGATGPQGPAGSAGAVGATGAQGPTGPAGSAANAADWALFPAVGNVDISGFNINNATTVNAGTLTSGTLNGTNLNVYDSFLNGLGNVQIGSPLLVSPAAGTVNINGTATIQRGTSNTYINAGGIVYQGDSVVPAVNGVRFGTLPVSGINTCRMELNTLTAPSAIQLVAPAFITIDTVGAANMTAGTTATVQAGTVATIECAAKDIRLQGTGGSYSDVTMFGGTLAGMGNLTGQAGTGVALGNVGSITGVSGEIPVATTLTGNAPGVDFRTFGDVISSFGTIQPNSLNTIGPQTRFKDTLEFYVSKGGSDITGTGSVLNPFATVQTGITAAEAVSGVVAGVAQIAVVNIAPGHYTEDISFNKGYIVLNGVLSTQTTSEVVEITGGITISCVGTNDTFQRIVSFQGLNITCPSGNLITDNSTSSHTVSFQDCKIATDGQLFLGASTAADQRTYFTNCDITQTNTATTADIMFFNLGQVEIERVDMGTVGNASLIEIGGTAILSRMSLTTLESGTASTTAAPILLISSTTLSSHNIGNSTFFYSNAASKNASASSNAIRIASGVATTMILLNNYYTMTGCGGSVNNVIGYNGVGTPTLLMNENRALFIPTVFPNTVTIQSGITKINYTDMNGPAVGSYSSSADQPAAAASAATTLTFNTTEKEFNTSLQLTNRIYALATGTYRFDYSIQFDNTDASAQTANIWISKNGTNVLRSASTIRLGASGAAAHQQFPFCSYTLDLNAGDYLSVLFNATSTNVIANATAAAAPVPAIPSIIVNLMQVGS